MPIMVVAIWIFTERAKVAYRRTRQTVGAVAAGFQENVDGVRVVQAFSREEVNEDQFDRLNEDNRQANVNANTLSSGLMPVIECANALATVAVVWYGGSLVLAGDGEVTLGVLVAFLTYVTRFFQPLRELTQFYNQLQAAMAGAEKVFELLDEPVTLAERREPDHPRRPCAATSSSARSASATATTTGSSSATSRFEIPAGTMTALVGHTGAGKTTISSLLARFYDPAEGAVLLDGHDLRDLSFAAAAQATWPWSSRTTSCSPAPSPTTSATAARRPPTSRSWKRRSWPTPTSSSRASRTATRPSVMERAANLSLGQRQLIAIARAVLADPRVLILDEATSNVDPRTEVRLQQALNTLLAGRTSLVVAHRSQHHPRGRSGAGGGRRRDRRARPPRGAAAAAGGVLPALPAAVRPRRRVDAPRRPMPRGCHPQPGVAPWPSLAQGNTVRSAAVTYHA